MTDLDQAHVNHSKAKINLDIAQQQYNQTLQVLAEHLKKSNGVKVPEEVNAEENT